MCKNKSVSLTYTEQTSAAKCYVAVVQTTITVTPRKTDLIRFLAYSFFGIA